MGFLNVTDGLLCVAIKEGDREIAGGAGGAAS